MFVITDGNTQENEPDNLRDVGSWTIHPMRAQRFATREEAEAAMLADLEYTEDWQIKELSHL